MNKMVLLGNNNFIVANDILAIMESDIVTAKKQIDLARNNEKLLDYTKNKKTKSLIITRDGYVVLSMLSTSVIVKRVEIAFQNE